MASPYVVTAVLAHADRLVLRGLADGRPIRIDGFGSAEASDIRAALLTKHPGWRIHTLGSDNNEASGDINAERATRYRNETGTTLGSPPFILIAPIGTVVESSLDEPAFFVIARSSIFVQALSERRLAARVAVADVHAIREASRHRQAESVYAFLAAWDEVTGEVDADAPLLHLGLLADSRLGGSVDELKARLRRNSDAVEILLRPGVSPDRMVGELVLSLGVDSGHHDELVALRSWLNSGRARPWPRLVDFAEWDRGGGMDGGGTPSLNLNPDLANPPHQGWHAAGDTRSVDDPNGSSKIAWSITNRRAGHRVELDLIEEISQEVIKSLGKTQALSKSISWPRVLGGSDIETQLRELNPAGDFEGYLFRIRARLLDGRTILLDKETEPFQIPSLPNQIATQAAAPTAWHAMYRFHAERASSPRISAMQGDDLTLISLEDGNSRQRLVRIDVSPVLVDMERQMLARPDRVGAWKAALKPGPASAPAEAVLEYVTAGTDDRRLLAARAAFLELVFRRGLVETLDFQDAHVRQLALEYIDAWVDLAKAKLNDAHPGAGLANQTRLDAAALASIDTIQLIFTGEGETASHEVLLVTPLHPAVVAWALDFHDLVHEWSRGTFDPATKPPYRAGPSGSAVLGGVEGFSAAPRAMVLFSGFDHEVLPSGWAYSGSVHPLWQCFVRLTGSAASRAREWPEVLAQLLELSDVPVGGNRIDARRVGSRLKKYAILHPYARQLKIAALVAGDGHPLLDALKVIDEKPGTPVGAQSIRDLRYELQVVGPASDRLGSAIEELTSNPGDGRWQGYAATVLDNPETVLSPGFAFGVHAIDASQDAANQFWPAVTETLRAIRGGTNVVIFGSMLSTSARAVPAPEAPAGFGARGIVVRPTTVVTAAGEVTSFAGNWTLVIPRPNPEASAAGAAQSALLRLLGVAGGAANADHQVGLDVALAGPVSAALEAAHEVSDWVIMADPLFSVELLDRAGTGTGTVLLDYTPEFDPYPGGRVVVSTSTLSELDKLGVPNPDAGLASAALMRVLSSISARLLLSLANPTKQTVRGLHGLALTRVFLRAQYPNALVIPMDGHADMFAVPRVGGTSRLADLLAVSVSEGRLHFDVVESKWVGKANRAAKVADGAAQARVSTEVLRAEFLAYPGVDRALRIDALREIILFHLGRAQRHDLPPPFTRGELIAATANDEAVRQATVDAHVIVWCPDAETDFDPVEPDVNVVQFGEPDIRRHAVAMNGWPGVVLVDDSSREETVTEMIYEELIGSTLEDDLAERQTQELPADLGEREPETVEAGLAAIEPDKGPDFSELTEVPTGNSSAVTAPGREEGTAPADTSAGSSVVDAPILLGHRVRGGDEVRWSPGRLANGHLIVLGGSGAGKTTLLRKLAGCITARGVPALVLDFHGDLTLPDGEFSHDFSYDGNASFVNPLHLETSYADSISPSRLKWEFLEAWRSQYPTLGVQQRNYLTTLIEESYRKAGITDDPGTWTQQVDFSNVLAAFEQSDVAEAQKQRIDAYMKQYREWRVFHGGTAISVESMLQRSTRLNLSQLDEAARNIVADVVLRRLFLLAKALGPIHPGSVGWDRFRAYVVIDEAQVLMTSNSDAKASLAKYAAEARKFGIGLILATQLRDNVPSEVWGNIDSRMFMLALDPVERAKNARAASLPEQSIAALKQGEAFFLISSRPEMRPVHVAIDRTRCD